SLQREYCRKCNSNQRNHNSYGTPQRKEYKSHNLLPCFISVGATGQRTLGTPLFLRLRPIGLALRGGLVEVAIGRSPPTLGSYFMDKRLNIPTRDRNAQQAAPYAQSCKSVVDFGLRQKPLCVGHIDNVAQTGIISSRCLLKRGRCCRYLNRSV